MATLWNRAGHFIFAPWFLSSFFSSPNLSGGRLDVYHTFTYDVALVRIYNAGLKCAARGSLEIQDAKKSPKICHLLASLGHPSKFQCVSRLGSVTARHSIVGANETLQR